MAKKLWGGRFTKGTHPFFEKFSSSIATDYRLAECDLIGSYLHVSVLTGAKLLSKTESMSLKIGIKSLLSQVQKGAFKFDPEAEDVHTCLQNSLEKKVGKVIEKLQTCRSRNDQVVFDTKLYCLQEAVYLYHVLLKLKDALFSLGRKNAAVLMPGFTHLQHAQVIYFKDYTGAYEAMFEEDASRLECFFGRLEITLGSGALAGTMIPAAVYTKEIKKALKELGMTDPLYEVLPPKNSLVNVSDRDFLIELLSALAIIGMHVSRFSEDLILMSSKEFDFIELADEFCTGSSLMPQKKNPDALELMRGASGLLYGNLVSVLTTMKGLPLSYNRDMQWDKQPLFSSCEIIRFELGILCPLIETIKINKEKLDAQLKDEALYATDLADYLVSRGVSFQNAHHAVGKLIQYSLSTGKAIKTMTEKELKQFSGFFDKAQVVKRLNPVFSVSLKKSIRR